MNFKVVKFKNRNPNDASNKALSEMYTNGPKFDMDLIAADRSIVSIHKFVACMFSGYLKDYLREFKPKGKSCVPLSEISLFVLKSVIELFYNGHVMIGDEVKPHIVKALTMLKVGNVVISTPEKHAEQLAQMAAPKTNKPVRCSLPAIPPELVEKFSVPLPVAYQPGKRRRAQSVFVDRTASTLIANEPALPQYQPVLPASISITKPKVDLAVTANTIMPMELPRLSGISISRVQKTSNAARLPSEVPDVDENMNVTGFSKSTHGNGSTDECMDVSAA